MDIPMRRRAVFGLGATAGLAVLGLDVGAAHAAGPSLPILGPPQGNRLHVMSFNIRVPVDGGARSWGNRLPRIVRVVKAEQPTILGTQEGRKSQIQDLVDRLPGYRFVARPSEAGGRGATCAILYRHDRLKKIDSGHLWLSDRPHQAGSITWGNRFPRMMTWVKFEDRNTGKKFIHVNTHFDHVSSESRRKSARFVRQWIRDRSLPTLVTGDFNTTPGSTPHDTLTSGKVFDTWNRPEKRRTPSFKTANGWNPVPKRSDRRIDWILGTDGVAVHATAINTWVTKHRNTPSDHWAIQAVVSLP